MHPAILEKRGELITACEQFNVARLDIFGSAARGGDFNNATSDADFLVDFVPGTKSDVYFDLKETFERILGRHVDLVERKAIETSRNYIRRRHILSQAESVYVA
ncbi:MAG: nucleotidyltransferase domain-containing protein [Beijerinckiaceae bacterium]